MDYRILLQEENDAVRERYELSMERIRSQRRCSCLTAVILRRFRHLSAG